MVIQIYSLINSIIAGLNIWGVDFYQYSLIAHMEIFILKMKLRVKFLDVEQFPPKNKPKWPLLSVF